jgi:hypothetical protein
MRQSNAEDCSLIVDAAAGGCSENLPVVHDHAGVGYLTVSACAVVAVMHSAGVPA